MTAHGRSELVADGVKVTVDLRSVNHRQFEARIDLPSEVEAVEGDLRARLHERIARGYVTCRVHLDMADGIKLANFRVDYRLAVALVGHMRHVGRKLGLKDDLTISALLSVPGIVAGIDLKAKKDELAPKVFACLDRALKSFLAMRSIEGRELARDILARLKILDKVVDAIVGRAPAVAEAYRKALQARLHKAGVALAQADDRLLREVALFADRSDITEETTRLRSHLKQARAHLASAAPVGRTLDFLLQEMFREINTVGSKANDAAIAGMVVKAKTELERIREQIQNVE